MTLFVTLGNRIPIRWIILRGCVFIVMRWFINNLGIRKMFKESRNIKYRHYNVFHIVRCTNLNRVDRQVISLLYLFPEAYHSLLYQLKKCHFYVALRHIFLIFHPLSFYLSYYIDKNEILAERVHAYITRPRTQINP